MTLARPALAFLLLCAAAVSGCDAQPQPADLEEPDRGSVGKADGISGSCVDACDDQALGGCWCDEECAEFGDCCGDYVAACVETDAPIGIDAPDEELREAAGFAACTGEPADDAVLAQWAEAGGVAILGQRRRQCSTETGCMDWSRAEHIPSDSFVLNPAEAVTVTPLEEGWRVEVGTLATCVGPADALQCELQFPLVDEARAEFAPGQLQMREGCGDLIISRSEFVTDEHWYDSLLAVRLEQRGVGPISERLEDQLRTPTPVELLCNTTHYATRFTCSQPWDYSTRGTLDMSIRMRGGELETVEAEPNVPEPLRGELQSDSFSNSGYSWRTTVRADGDRVEIRYSRDTLGNTPSWCSFRTGYLQECVASFVAMP